MKVMFLFRYFLGSFKHIGIIISKISLVIVTVCVIFAMFLAFTNNRVTIDPKRDAQMNRKHIYQNLNNISNSKDGAMASKTYSTFMCFTIGEACTNNPNDGDANYQKTLLGTMTGLLTMPYVYPPASGTFYALEKFNDAGVIPNTYAAQGVGFSSLKIFQPIWEVFRNLTFLILVIIIIVVGFMIMFRMKLDPHTVVSLENALPKIILTMVLITFSYAIAGFLIDMMYVSIVVVINILSKPGGFDPTLTSSSFLTHDLFNMPFKEVTLAGGPHVSVGWSSSILVEFFKIYFTGIYAILDVLPTAIHIILNIIIGLVGLFIALKVGGFLGLPIAQLLGKWNISTMDGIVIINGGGAFEFGSMLGQLSAYVIGFFLSTIFFSLLIGIIVIIGLFLLLLRIFFVLLSSYIQILVQIMFAPLFLLREALPGQSGFMPWIRNLTGNLAVFPVLVALILVIYIINFQIQDVAGPTLVGVATGGLVSHISSGQPEMFLPPMMMGLNSDAFIAIINAAFLVMIPDLLKAVRQLIVGKEGGMNIGPGALFAGTIGGVVGGGMGMFNQFGSLSHGAEGIKKLFGAGAPPVPGQTRQQGVMGAINRAFGTIKQPPKQPPP